MSIHKAFYKSLASASIAVSICKFITGALLAEPGLVPGANICSAEVTIFKLRLEIVDKPRSVLIRKLVGLVLLL